jgi:hypothetical protein
MATRYPRRRSGGTIGLTAFAIAALAAASAPTCLAASVGDAEARCRRLDARLTLLQERLRAGYTARQGRLWRQQLAALEAERRATCR